MHSVVSSILNTSKTPHLNAFNDLPPDAGTAAAAGMINAVFRHIQLSKALQIFIDLFLIFYFKPAFPRKRLYVMSEFMPQDFTQFYFQLLPC